MTDSAGYDAAGNPSPRAQQMIANSRARRDEETARQNLSESPPQRLPFSLPFSLCDPDAVLTAEQRKARDNALRGLAEARRQGPSTSERVL